MVSLKEDSIDFKKLEQEFYNAVEADARYDRENSAKFRAVNQKVGSYEEFRYGASHGIEFNLWSHLTIEFLLI